MCMEFEYSVHSRVNIMLKSVRGLSLSTDQLKGECDESKY
jgi:hypothetical protein